jgi:dihydrofolate synthase / folylpolyglutamate synthase
LEFDDARAYLDAHIDLEKTSGISAGHVAGLSLDRMRLIAEVLGDPQFDYPVIHVTGTNGKGSTARMVTALVAAHQLSVGTYTSPHLEHVTERISRNAEPIDPEEFARVVGEIAALEEQRFFGDDRPSYFELLTASAFAWFSEEAVDAAVLEVGLLGRYDATNVANAEVAVVTNVRRDHTDGVGDWRARVAAEKAGIVKPGSRLVLGETDPELRPLFLAEDPVETWVRDEDFGIETDRLALGGHVVDLRTPFGRHEDVFLPVHGAHQADNAAVAVAAAESFFGRALHADVVTEAFAGVRLPGRFEVLRRAPLLVLDGAHNADGATTVAATLADEFDVSGTRHWVLGMLAGRDLDEMIDALSVRPGDRVVTTTPPTPRGVPAPELAKLVADREVDVEAVPSVEGAVERAWGRAEAGGEGDLVMVTGSLYTAGAARTACRRLGLLS